MMMTLIAGSQVTLKTIVSRGPIIAGESFQVQYVLEDKDGQEADFYQPDFRQFVFVSGPHLYGGVGYSDDGPIKLKNITFTLIAPKQGKYIVPGASVKSNGKIFSSEPAHLEVISRNHAVSRGIIDGKLSTSDGAYLLPGEDPAEKIKQNIFLKVIVDKKTCYVGQPVTATFKLYSRLNSRSDIVKNPGFYGFAMQDMIGLSDNVSSEEIVNGKKFQVHTIRKVQLYPQQAGILTIDPMEVQNKVAFAVGNGPGMIQQEIIEGVLSPEEESPSTPGIKYCENSMHTEPIVVRVNPLPETNKPDTFNGATGRFRISAILEKADLAVNEEGVLQVIISGKGNFIQVAPPVIKWPAGIEGFTPQISDSLNRQISPLEGNRLFRFRFVPTRKGSFTIPAVSFSFFDTDSNRYRTVSTEPIIADIRDAKQKDTVVAEMQNIKTGISLLWTGLGAIALLGMAGFFFIRKRNASPGKPEEQKPTDASEISFPGVNEFLHPAKVLVEADGFSFYAALRKAIWNFCSELFSLSGSNMNKRNLQQAMQERRVSTSDQETLLRILDMCEAGLFTGAISTADKKQLLNEAKAVMQNIASDR